MKKIIAIVLFAATSLSPVAFGGNKTLNNEQSSIRIEITTPFIEYSSVEEAEKAVGFDVDTLSNIPDGFEQDSIFVISDKCVEVNFKNGEKEICYRVAQGSVDISGDYNKYTENITVRINDTEVVTKGNSGKINVATWTKDGMTYSLSTSGLEKTIVIELISSII
ncbi:DUF4367 domain-containing protein [Clostridium sediminicola]|uniref:DUF4367 domain-containing protein n=1 Tax=Clostridium sediminicola TaxID=3114879 RepID=UPI0031F22455